MKIEINPQMHLELWEAHHAEATFEMIDKNRLFLRKWLAFVDNMQTVEQIHNYSKFALQRNAAGTEAGFVIFENDKAIGRIGINRIIPENKIGEIGYWITEAAEGKGIITSCSKAMLKYGFSNLGLNRIEIKCAVDNIKSARVPEKLNFTREGILRQAELLNGNFVDLYLFSLLKNEWNNI